MLVRKYYREKLRIAFHIMRKKDETILVLTFIHQRIEKADIENADRVVKCSLPIVCTSVNV